jgi:hypothetical protein
LIFGFFALYCCLSLAAPGPKQRRHPHAV